MIGRSSTPRLLDSISGVSGILGRPVKPGDDGRKCFAFVLKHSFAISPHVSREFCIYIRTLRSEGAGNAGCPMHPQASCARSGVVKQAHEFSQRSHRNDPAFPAQWSTAFLDRAPRRSAHLPPSPAKPPPARHPRQGVRTTRLHRPRRAPSSKSTLHVHRHPPRVRDVRETPL
jgi:hypothetical protein